MTDQEIPGNPGRPRYYHLPTGFFVYVSGRSIQNRDAARRKLVKKVTAAGGDEGLIQYRAGLGGGLLKRS